ncbi:MAG TPA: SDR family oxidoreductase [Candidatus Sulfotelmatobacter sp.]|nr:SDR family oxidoreductase [Candidatus Sulfotelmatobacter sp.]
MDLELRGQAAIITGGSRGIGRAIAGRLAQEGMDVAIAARDARQLQRVKNEIEGPGRRVLIQVGDLREPSACAILVAAAVEAFGRLDLLVNNAGATQRGDFLELTDDAWADGFRLKFMAAVRVSRAAWPHLVRNNGSIINIAGVGARTGNAEFTIGGAVNSAMLNLTKALADRGVKDGVRVNAINPGSIVTDRLTRRVERVMAEHQLSYDDAYDRMLAETGVARFGTVDEISAAVAFLASRHAAYFQGALIDVDGGWTRAL